MAFEDDLKRRMALAKQQGWSDDEINRSALINRALNNQQQQQQAATAQPTNQPSGLKKFLVNAGALVGSTAAGIGALAAAPVTGGVSLAGGFAAGAGIEALRRKMLGEKQSVGASLLQGGLNILPVAGQAVKAARGAKVGADLFEAANIGKAGAQVAARDATQRVATVAPKIINTRSAEVAAANRESRFANPLEFNTAKPGQASNEPIQIPSDVQPGKAGQVIDNVKQQFQPGDPTIFGRTGDKLRASGRGIQTGGRVQGNTDRLLPSQADDINGFLDSVGAKGSAEKQLQRVEQVQSATGQHISNVMERTNAPIAREDVMNLQNKIQSRIAGENGEGIAGFNPTDKGHLDMVNSLATQMSNIKDTKGLQKFKQSLDDSINYARKSATPDPMREQINKAFRQEVSGELNNRVPELAPYNKIYSNSVDAKNALVLNSNPKGFNVGTVFQTPGNGVGGSAVQAGKSAVGTGLQQVDKVVNAPAMQQFAKQFGLKLVSGGFNGGQGDDSVAKAAQAQLASNPGGFPDASSGDAASINGLLAGGAKNFNDIATVLDGGGGPNSAGATQTSPLGFTREDLLNAAQQIITDPNQTAAQQKANLANIETLSGLLDNYDKSSSAAGGGAGTPNVTKVTAQQYGLAQSGQNALSQLSDLIGKDPGIVNKTATPGRGLPIVGGFISQAAGTGDYDAIGYNIADSILRLRTGATANASEVKNLQSQIMPRAGDSQQTIQTKLQQIQSIFGGVLGMAQQQPAASDFSSFQICLTTRRCKRRTRTIYAATRN